MFDAKSILESLVRGAAPSPAPQSQGGLGDILGQLGKAMGQGQGQGGSGQQPSAGGLEAVLRNMLPSGGAPGQGGQPQQGGGLADILGQLQKQLGQGAGQASGQGGAPAPGGGNLMDILGQVLGQATSGVKDGARRIDDATGASTRMREAVGGATGQSPDELMAKLQELIRNNQLAAGAAMGGLGGLVLGTKTGRSAAVTAAKIGALALIGGLAYKAYQNYSQGRPLVSGASGFAAEPAPQGSGFEPQAVSNDDAILYIRAMIAAAAADGRIDQNEQQKILGGLQQAGAGNAEAQQFLMNEINNPASADDLAAAVTSQEQAVQVFTAARLAVDLDTQEEGNFLVTLADRLDIDRKLAAHIDAAATATAA